MMSMSMSTPNQGQPEREESSVLVRKRKQLSSCDSCRHRRIRCARDNNGEVCKPCKVKHLSCTSNFIQSVPKLNSTTKRHAANPNPQESFIDPSVFSNYSMPQMPVQSHVYDNVIDAYGLSGNFGKHLVDCYYECLHFACPAVRWEDFYGEAVVADFNASKMTTPEGEVLCLVIQAFGSRVSDHPFILGPGAPARETLQRGSNLSEWGHKRKPFCMALLHRAMKTFHGRGIVHRVSVRSISIMVVLYWLWENTDPSGLVIPRLLTSNALEMMRIIIEQKDHFSTKDINDICGGRLFWTIFVGESACSAYTGRQLQMTVNDIQNFLPTSSQAAQLLDVGSNVDNNQYLSNVAVQLFGDMALIGRVISSQLTSPMAKQREISSTVLSEVWAGIKAHAELSAQIQKRIEDLFDKIPFSTEIWIKTNVCARVGYSEIVDSVIVERLKKSKETNDVEQTQRLETLALESKERVFKAQLELSEALTSHSHSKVIAFGGTLLMALPACIDRLLSVPAHEEGGNEEYPLSKKLQSCEVVLDNIKFTGYCWDIGQMIVSAEERLSTLRQLAGPIPAQSLGMIDLYNMMPDPNFDFYDPYGGIPVFPPNYMSATYLEDPLRDLRERIPQN